MRILLTGATGFLGSALVAALRARGFALRLAVRDVARARASWPDAEIVQADFTRLGDSAAWLPLLAGVDAVVNAVGLIRQSRAQTFEAVHVRAATALFAAAAQAGVERVIQISALGADDHATTHFHRSKGAADRALSALDLHACSVQPSLVFGAGGASAGLFERLALLPLIALPGAGEQRIQPIHVDDLVAAIAVLLAASRMPPRLAAVGGRCLTVREYLSILRGAMGAGPPRFLRVPPRLTRALAAAGDRFAALPLDSERLAMLERGNCADAGVIAAVLGHAPRAPEQFLTPRQGQRRARALRFARALLGLRLSVAVLWFVSGIVSLGLWPIADSLALLARCGLHGPAARIELFAAAGLDLAFGVAILALRRRWVYDLQLAVIAGYSAVIAVFLPEFLLHPFAPIVKNLCVAAAIWTLRRADEA